MIAEVLRAAAAIVILAWVPGRAWRPRLLPEARGLAAFVADVGLSITLVVLSVYLSSRFLGVVVAAPSALWIALAVAALGLVAPLGRYLDGLATSRA